MPIRIIGPLFCCLLMLAATTDAFAQVNKTTPLPSANASAVPTKNHPVPAPTAADNGVKAGNGKPACGNGGGGGKQMDDCNSAMQGVSTTR
jgi:hypothetical protein